MLILKIVALGPIDGYAIAQRIQQTSRASLQLQQGSRHPALHRPKDQAPVQDLIVVSLPCYWYHRFFYEVVFLSKRENRNAVLLSAASTSELDQLGAQLLTNPDSVCGGQLGHRTVFPEACTVSMEMQIVVNGAPRTAL